MFPSGNSPVYQAAKDQSAQATQFSRSKAAIQQNILSSYIETHLIQKGSQSGGWQTLYEIGWQKSGRMKGIFIPSP